MIWLKMGRDAMVRFDVYDIIDKKRVDLETYFDKNTLKKSKI